MARTRTQETDEERDERSKREALRVLDNRRAEDAALDAMVRESIKRHGP